MEKATNPIRPTDDVARALARQILADHHYAALGVTDPETGAPALSRVAYVWLPETAQILSLISDLSAHSSALAERPNCGLLIGSVPERGDPLTHPRLSLETCALQCDKAEKKAIYLAAYPKAKLYFDFSDFHMVEFTIKAAFLNGGFGQAFHLTLDDLRP
ncbi:pyridoxamine 5-phosphate oxidase [Paracoccaceae bacterium]|nr:pyridoxamine 5-phosphate oxidase [Paracoccaceae bacterium]